MRGPCRSSRASNQSRLCKIHTLFAVVHQHHIAAWMVNIFMLCQFCSNQTAALSAELQLQHVCADVNQLGRCIHWRIRLTV